MSPLSRWQTPAVVAASDTGILHLTQVNTVLRTTERQIQMISFFTHSFRTLPYETDLPRSAIF